MLARLYDTHIRGRKSWQRFDEMASFSGDGRELTAGRLASLLRHAARTVPFYRGKISPSLGDGEAFQALASLPVVGKRELNSFPELFLSSEPGRGIFPNFTSGSSGQFLRVLQDGEYFDRAMAGKYLFYTWAGWKPGDRILKLWNSHRFLLGRGERLRLLAGDVLRGKKLLNTFMVKTRDLDRYLGELRRFRPVLVELCVDAARAVAGEMQRRNVRPGPQLRGVIVSAGTLYPDTERLVGEAFGVPVTNRYGCTEAGDMACTCPAGRIHVNPFTHFLEVLDERGNPVAEGTGRVAVTLLTNYTMPLIRYDIQDMATVRREPSPCPCGREWQTLERVEGRTRTFFRCRDGSLLNPALIVRSMHHADRDEIIDCYQVVQEDFHRFTVRLTLLGGRDGEDAAVRELLGRMEPEIRGALGFDASISFSIEKEILPLPSGKHLYALSRLLDAE